MSPSLPSSAVGALGPLNNSAPLRPSRPSWPLIPSVTGGISASSINSSTSGSYTPLWLLSKYDVIRSPFLPFIFGFGFAAVASSDNALLTLPLLWLFNLAAASAKAFKSMVGVRPSLPSLMLATTGSSPGIVNVMSVLWPSLPRAVVITGVLPSRPAAPVSPRSPRSPLAPCAPVNPRSPWSPFSPLAPSAMTTSFSFVSPASNSLLSFWS